MAQCKPRQLAGFTLLEVMIALVILSVAFSAIIFSVNSNSRDLFYLQQKTAAEFVAANVMTEAQLGLLTVSGGSQRQLDHNFHWILTTQSTENASIETATVSVSDQPRGTPIAKLEGFIRRDT